MGLKEERADEKERLRREKITEIMGEEREMSGLIKIYIYIYFFFTIMLQYNFKDRIIL